MSGRDRAVEAIRDSRLIVVLRHIPSAVLDSMAAALQEGGIRVVEVALNTTDAIAQLRSLQRFEFCVGAGTALEERGATTAIEAGASFLFSPIRSPFFLPLCRKRDVLGIPGGLTPTEIYTLHAEGADFIKVFPSTLAGPDYLEEILAPCEGLRLIPTGGVTVDTLESFLEAGAAAVAVGKEIADPQLAAEKKFSDIVRRAAQFTQKIKDFSRIHVPS